ncbi:MAG: D-alanine--D-alanine ligase [Elusimicrobia bacterium]|nr:D-alanine--D-alanine ligase [Elusimicrobiota bacterium]
MKKNIGVIFGGRSAEHEVSIESAKTVVKNLSLAGYAVSRIYIPRRGAWRLVSPAAFAGGRLAGADMEPSFEKESFTLAGRPFRLDAVFPLVHGSTGEDGILQGFLELLGLPYVGSGVLASAAGMDKALSKEIARKHGIPLLAHVEISGRDKKRAAAGLKAARRLGLPLFVKPVQLGSSVGITKVKAFKDLAKAVAFAFRYDSRVLIEKGVDRAREIVCGALGSASDVRASVCGEVRPKGGHEFYDYEAKYLDDNGIDFLAPAPLSKKTAGRLRALTVAVFRAMGCYGMARVDFLMDPRSEDKFYFCEINTIPGFTSHSLYPTLWKKTGLSPVKLADRLVRLAIERQKAKSRLKTERG